MLWGEVSLTREGLLGLDQGTREVRGKQSQKPERAVHPDIQKGVPELGYEAFWEKKASALGPLGNPLTFYSWLEHAECKSQIGTRIRERTDRHCTGHCRWEPCKRQQPPQTTTSAHRC